MTADEFAAMTFEKMAEIARQRDEHDLAERLEAYARGERPCVETSAVPNAESSPGATHSDSTSPAPGESVSGGGSQRTVGAGRGDSTAGPDPELAWTTRLFWGLVGLGVIVWCFAILGAIQLLGAVGA